MAFLWASNSGAVSDPSPSYPHFLRGAGKAEKVAVKVERILMALINLKLHYSLHRPRKVPFDLVNT